MLKAEYNCRDKTADSLFIHSDPACWRSQPWCIALSPSRRPPSSRYNPLPPSCSAPYFCSLLAQIMHSVQKREYNRYRVNRPSIDSFEKWRRIIRLSIEHADIYSLQEIYLSYERFIFIGITS